MLEVQQLAVSYRGGQGLGQVSFQLLPGQLVGIVGPNGAGKSTLMKAMLGLIPADGQVRYCTCPLCHQLERVAYMPQRSQVDWDFPISVWNVVMTAWTRKLGWFRGSSRAAKAIVSESLERVEMLSFRNRRLGELSGGQQQRVFLARALAQQADILLFDEPFAGIDQPTETIIFSVFDQLKAQGKILLVSSHDWGESMSQLDRLLLLNQSLIADGLPEQVMTPENLQRAYRGAVGRRDLDTPFFC
jgi:manganese/iron transport system ATP-binding protein